MSLGLLPRQLYTDANGDPISGLKCYIYDVGTENIKAIWLNADFSGAAPNPMDYVLATGFPVWYVDGAYKIVITKPDGSGGELTVYTDDNVEAATVNSATTSVEGTVQIATAGQVAAGTAGFVMDTGDIDQMAIDGGQVGGTLGASTIPNLDAAKITTGTFDPARIAAATETILGIVEKATEAEVTAGTANKFIDAALLQFGLTANIEADFTNKWIKMTTVAGIFIIQWDTSTVTPNTSTNKTLKETMADTGYVILVTADDASASRSENNGAVVVSATTIQLWSGDSSVNSLHWVVIGEAA